MDVSWGDIVAGVSALSFVGGGLITLIGQRLKLAHEDRAEVRKREVSAQDILLRLDAAERRVETLDVKLHSVEQENAALRVRVENLTVKNESLQAQYTDLSARYDRLRDSHDGLLRGVCPAPDEECPLRSRTTSSKHSPTPVPGTNP